MTPADALMDAIEWVPVEWPTDTVHEPGLPYVTHSGVLRIGSIELRCHQLNDGRRMIDADDFIRLFAEEAT